MSQAIVAMTIARVIVLGVEQIERETVALKEDGASPQLRLEKYLRRPLPPVLYKMNAGAA
jgi:hypothetical protein